MRLKDGDSPSVVTRELLIAGIPPEVLRGVLMEASAAGSRSRRDAAELTALGVIKGLLTGSFTVFGSRDKRDPDRFAAAYADVEYWNTQLLDA
jgi:hypothetical protein